MKQIKFMDTDNNVIHGGIRLDNGDVVCGCCGRLIPNDEQNNNYGFLLIEEYNDWVGLDDNIIGE